MSEGDLLDMDYFLNEDEAFCFSQAVFHLCKLFFAQWEIGDIGLFINRKARMLQVGG